MPWEELPIDLKCLLKSGSFWHLLRAGPKLVFKLRHRLKYNDSYAKDYNLQTPSSPELNPYPRAHNLSSQLQKTSAPPPQTIFKSIWSTFILYSSPTMRLAAITRGAGLCHWLLAANFLLFPLWYLSPEYSIFYRTGDNFSNGVILMPPWWSRKASTHSICKHQRSRWHHLRNPNGLWIGQEPMLVGSGLVPSVCTNWIHEIVGLDS